MKTVLNDSSQNKTIRKSIGFICLLLIFLVPIAYEGYSIPSDPTKEKVDLINTFDNAIYLSRHLRFPDIKSSIEEMSLKENEDRFSEYQKIIEQNLSISLESNDSVIYHILKDSFYDTNSYHKKEKKRYKKFNTILREGLAKYLAFNILELNKPAANIKELKYFLSKIQHLETAFQVQQKLEKFIEDELKNNPYVDEPALTENMKAVKKHMAYLTDNQYVNYAVTSQSKSIIKGVNVLHDNDILAFQDEDRDYTGGVFVEITTDYLKMRVLPRVNDDRWLSYQGLFYGVEAYTPEIRDTVIFNTPTSYDSTDRPFASYKYFGRSKYRIHYKGIYRMKGFYKFGTIGGDLSNYAQSMIHRDVSGSVNPMGWDSQVGYPGRWAFQYDEYYEAMLFSGQGDIWNHRRKLKNSNFLNKINISGKIGWHLGWQLNAVDFGLAISNKNFRDQSGGNDIRLPKGKKFQYLLMAEINYRYVAQNTMLEGYSFSWLQFFNQKNDVTDMYVLTSDQVVRNIFFGSFFAGIRVIKMTFYYKYSFIQGEYVIDNKKAATHYWGTLGFNFLI